MGTPRTFDTIAIIFNPNSTGDAPALAEQLKASLSGLLPYAADIRLQPTSPASAATGSPPLSPSRTRSTVR